MTFLSRTLGCLWKTSSEKSAWQLIRPELLGRDPLALLEPAREVRHRKKAEPVGDFLDLHGGISETMPRLFHTAVGEIAGGSHPHMLEKEPIEMLNGESRRPGYLLPVESALKRPRIQKTQHPPDPFIDDT